MPATKTAYAEALTLSVICPFCNEEIPAPRSRHPFVWARPDAIRVVAAGRIRCDDCGVDLKVPALVAKLGEV